MVGIRFYFTFLNLLIPSKVIISLDFVSVHEAEDNEMSFVGKIEEQNNKEQGPRRRKKAIDVVYQSLKAVVGREAINRKAVPHLKVRENIVLE